MVIIRCPRCQTRFNLDGVIHALGKPVRCPRCQTKWIAVAEEDFEKKPLFELPSSDLPAGPIPEADLKSTKPRARWLYGALSVGIILVIAGFFFLRSRPTETGLMSDLSLVLAPLEYQTEIDPPVLIVRGAITNQTNQLYRLPSLNIVLLNAKKQVLETKTRLPPMRLLGPGRQIEFRYEISAPPTEVNKVEVNFDIQDTTE